MLVANLRFKVMSLDCEYPQSSHQKSRHIRSCKDSSGWCKFPPNDRFYLKAPILALTADTGRCFPWGDALEKVTVKDPRLNNRRWSVLHSRTDHAPGRQPLAWLATRTQGQVPKATTAQGQGMSPLTAPNIVNFVLESWDLVYFFLFSEGCS